MFEAEYRRLNDAIHADEGLIRQTVAAVRTPRRTTPLLPILAALACLMALLISPRMLRNAPAADVTSHNPTVTPAPVFTPVGHVTEADGMTLRYLASYASEGSAYILISLEGEAVMQEMSLTFALTSEKTGQTFWLGAQQLDHDAARQRSTFVVAYHEDDLPEYTPVELTATSWRFPSTAYDPTTFRPLPPDDRLTLTLLDYDHLLHVPLGDALPLAALPTDAGTVSCTVDGVIYPADAGPDAPQLVLDAATGMTVTLHGDVRVTAGFADDGLRVQLRIPGGTLLAEGSETLGCWIYLVPQQIADVNPWRLRGIHEGIPQPALMCVRTDSGENLLFRDYRFDVDRTALLADGWQLSALVLHTVDLPDNASRLVFTLGE